MNSGWEIASSISAMIQTLITGFIAWYGYRKYISEESTNPSDDRIQIFSTSKQTTELRATDKGLECHIFDIRHGRGGHQWTLTKDQLINIQVTLKAVPGKAGRLRIGVRIGWLYSYKLWPDPKELVKAINKLVAQI